jgi:hypothetical protein
LVGHREQLLGRSGPSANSTALRRQRRYPDKNQQCQNREPSVQIGHIVIKPKPAEGVAIFILLSTIFPVTKVLRRARPHETPLDRKL